MGICSSLDKSDRSIEKQEKYVQQRMKDPDIHKLTKMRSGLFHHGKNHKYSSRQIKAYLRQEYHGTRHMHHLNSYVAQDDLKSAGVETKRHYQN